MKQLKTTLTAMLLLCCTTMSAHDFEVDGIYYKILSGEEVEVTYRGSTYSNYSDRYTDSVTIPQSVTYNGTTFNVTTIGSYAFYYCSNLTSVKMPNSITTIGDNSFYFCENLTSIDMSEALTTISSCAFYNCNKLNSIEIPASVTTIGDAAFYSCWSLKSIEIPANAAIAYNSFYGCSSLNKIMSYVPAENLFEIGWMTFYPADKSSCTLYVPKGTKEAYENTVGWNEFTNIEEFNGKCGKNAIWKYNEETATLTISGEGAIYDYNHYTSNEEEWSPWKDIYINELIIEEGITSIGSCAFTSCDCINITIPNTVTAIGHSAFAGTSFYNFSFPAYLTTIGEKAFSDCLNFNYDDYGALTIPASVTSIGVGAFEGCESIVKIIVNEENPTYDSRENCNAIIETATNKLIAGCRNSVVPGTVTAIEDYAFCGHRQLQNIAFPNSVTTIGSNVFYGCEFLYSISIGSGVSSFGTNNFFGCGYLTSIVVDKNNPVYDSRDNCNAIIETATNTLVAGCVSTEIPTSVTSIGESAFNNCYTLKNITIPANVTYIGTNAFSCWQLANVTSFIPADKLFAIDSYVFSSVNKSNCVLYVPYGAKNTYAATSGWNEFTNIVELSATFDLTVSAAGYATLYLDYNAIIPEGVEIYTASSVDGNYLMMQEVTDILPANTGVIARAEQGTYTFVESTETVGAIEGNLFRGSVEDTYITPAKGARYYVLSMKDGVVGMYADALTGGTFKNNAHKAYLALQEKGFGIYDEEIDTEDPGMQLSNKYYFDFSGTTAIDPVVTEVNDNIYYDLSGRRVENPTRGIYIVNGQKVVIK